MVDKNQTKTLVRQREYSLKSRLGKYCASKMEAKIARTFTDDMDYHHGATSAFRRTMRPGLRDDEVNCAFSFMLVGL